MLDAAIEGPAVLGAVLGCEVAEGWEGFPEALPRVRDSLAGDPDGGRWGTRLFVLEEPRVLVGWGGFKGAPVDGEVELGYAIAPDFRGRGLATEAVRQMLADAYSDDEIKSVIAHTLPEQNPSTRVLHRANFTFDPQALHDTEGQSWRWRHTRTS